MRLEAQHISKKFNSVWIFKNISFTAVKNDIIGITGSNGSGKSTLLQILAGYMTPDRGNLTLFIDEKKTEQDDYYKYISMSSPFLELVEDFTLQEQMDFYFKFKPLYSDSSVDELLQTANIHNHTHKQVKNFSSGMKQRVKLLLAFASATPVLFLDEPCTNLDGSGIEWYKMMFQKFSSGRIIIVSSNNQSDELFRCNKFLSVDDFKNNIPKN